MTIELELVNPLNTTYDRWAANLSEQLASYNAPSPGEEGSWAGWASIICSIPELAELGVPTPSGFRTWRDWALAFLQVIG